MKVAICTPYHGDVTAEFAFSLAEMAMRSVRSAVRRGERTGTPEIRIFALTASRLARGRNQIMTEAVAWGAEFQLWLDADQSFPDDTLLRLLSLDVLVVGANYPRRALPTGPTASRHKGGRSKELVFSTAEALQQGPLERVDTMGLGCCLLDLTIMPLLEQRAREAGEPSVYPLFADVSAPDPLDDIGEDAFFFRRLKRAGVPVYVDHWLSRRVGHVTRRILTWRDVEAEREQYLASMERPHSSARES